LLPFLKRVEANALHRQTAEGDSPLKGSENAGSDSNVVDAATELKAIHIEGAVGPDSEGDETGEPEEHGERIKGEGTKVVVDLGASELHGNHKQSGGDEDGPYGVEDVEGHLAGRVIVEVSVAAVGSVGDYGEEEG
jgi:hypothetical protein